MSTLDPLTAATVTCVALAAVTLIGLEVVRSVVDARRKRATGIGGTQDIAIWGLVLTGIFLTAAIVLGVICLVMRFTGAL